MAVKLYGKDIKKSIIELLNKDFKDGVKYDLTDASASIMSYGAMMIMAEVTIEKIKKEAKK